MLNFRGVQSDIAKPWSHLYGGPLMSAMVVHIVKKRWLIFLNQLDYRLCLSRQLLSVDDRILDPALLLKNRQACRVISD